MTAPDDGTHAFLVTWDAANESAWEVVADRGVHRDQPVALVLEPNLDHGILRQIVEALYSAFSFDARDMLGYVRSGTHPYRAQWDEGSNGRMLLTCGHNPHLLGREVRNLRIERPDSRKRCMGRISLTVRFSRSVSRPPQPRSERPCCPAGRGARCPGAREGRRIGLSEGLCGPWDRAPVLSARTWGMASASPCGS